MGRKDYKCECEENFEFEEVIGSCIPVHSICTYFFNVNGFVLISMSFITLYLPILHSFDQIAKPPNLNWNALEG